MLQRKFCWNSWYFADIGYIYQHSSWSMEENAAQEISQQPSRDWQPPRECHLRAAGKLYLSDQIGDRTTCSWGRWIHKTWWDVPCQKDDLVPLALCWSSLPLPSRFLTPSHSDRIRTASRSIDIADDGSETWNRNEPLEFLKTTAQV